MTIYRKKPTSYTVLTPEELRQAYEEQQRIYDRENIVDNLEWILEAISCEREIGCSLEELRRNEGFVDMAAKISREKQDDEDISFTAAIQQGVKMALKERGMIK